MEEIKFRPFGDSAVTTDLSKNNRDGRLITEQIEKRPFKGLIEIVPGFTTITVYYDPFIVYQICNGESPFRFVEMKLRQIINEIDEKKIYSSREIMIPVCYGGDLGPDLENVAKYHHLTKEEVINLHISKEYVVHMIGFAPGFPYLSGLSKKIATPRKDTPRTLIPEGSVGIGGEQTGIYPLESPGGWNLIGRTPLMLFNPNANIPSLLQAGDIIRFQPITCKEFEELKEAERN
ncbi:5-oxoprolinase subunit PxpB [Metabacillus fastidiosus]|uniref:5-oxoprolinase subunit PxpB n=1 Tax=Metabacillus fastidiosus TaxID=1458 RepID=UPI002DB87F13|nr:5-oxoprolinase subunit PxpB [Metabacillus fastidiosus]MEC2075254.1 5-oxoprolinase subunit PxpB [Metabacillus fastidiosus]